MILEEDSNKRFGVPSVFEFFMIFPIFRLPKIIKKKKKRYRGIDLIIDIKYQNVLIE